MSFFGLVTEKELKDKIERIDRQFHRIEKELYEDSNRDGSFGFYYSDVEERPSIKGKLDALLQHLGLTTELKKSSTKVRVCKPRKKKK